ncbi:hypothetical protein BOTBODRAFT_56798 [Botryobasidium botryosum FD-172 SS1]|uniref:Uncharacterized protein n=1 Tax=Botryobasidium botryosum (strain FD-172 SS1) TaxID=930990 RepID=A0A067MLS5_BOTB1|nr:hypothetical protein BOTBODRAFT_56798 [Botryobasidium botryosum FD-172 SS1]
MSEDPDRTLPAFRFTGTRVIGAKPDGSTPAPPKPLGLHARRAPLDMAYYKDVHPKLRPSSRRVDVEDLKKIPPLPYLPNPLFPIATHFPFPPTIYCGLPITDKQIKKLLRDCNYRSFVPAFESNGVSTVAAGAISTYIRHRIDYFVDITTVLNVGGNDRILSFGDNYTLYREQRKIPTNETLQKLLELLELPAITKPKWYLCDVNYVWSAYYFPGGPF